MRRVDKFRTSDIVHWAHDYAEKIEDFHKDSGMDKKTSDKAMVAAHWSIGFETAATMYKKLGLYLYFSFGLIVGLLAGWILFYKFE